MSALHGEMLSIREFARRDGCDEKLVRKAISAGHLCSSPTGKLAADLVGTGWRRTNRRGADAADISAADTADSLATKVRTIRAPKAHSDGSSEHAASLSALIDTTAHNASELLLRHLPRDTVVLVVDELTARSRQAALEMLDGDAIASPAGFASWADHPWFLAPPMSEGDWAESADLAGAKEAEPPPVVAERILAATGATLTLAEAERVKENYLALLRQLEYEAKAGLLLSIADVEAVVGAVLDATRARVLAIPSKVSPLLASACSPIAAMQLLTAAVHEALRDLAATEVVVQDVKVHAGVIA